MGSERFTDEVRVWRDAHAQICVTSVAQGTSLGRCFAAKGVLEVAMHAPDISITETDSDRLSRLLDVLPDSRRVSLTGLESELARAHVVSSRTVPRDVVTMNSTVVFEDAAVRARMSP